jgi:hypothetical protein
MLLCEIHVIKKNENSPFKIQSPKNVTKITHLLFSGLTPDDNTSYMSMDKS